MRLEVTGPLSNREHVRLARFAATPTASPQGPAPITVRSSINAPLSRHFDDLIAMRADADVLDGRVRQVLEPIEVGAGPRRQDDRAPAPAQPPLPPREGVRPRPPPRAGH